LEGEVYNSNRSAGLAQGANQAATITKKLFPEEIDYKDVLTFAANHIVGCTLKTSPKEL
jgi:hypothetical protein